MQPKKSQGKTESTYGYKLHANVDRALKTALSDAPTEFNEYEDVLNREHLFDKSRLNTAERDELLDIFLAHCEQSAVAIKLNEALIC